MDIRKINTQQRWNLAPFAQKQIQIRRNLYPNRQSMNRTGEELSQILKLHEALKNDQKQLFRTSQMIEKDKSHLRNKIGRITKMLEKQMEGRLRQKILNICKLSLQMTLK